MLASDEWATLSPKQITPHYEIMHRCVYTILLQHWEKSFDSLVTQLQKRTCRDEFDKIHSNLHHFIAGPVLPPKPS